MQFDLHSGTDAGSHALFDPGAVDPLQDRAFHRDWEGWVGRLEQMGKILHYSESSDGDVRIKLIVDEEFSSAMPHSRERILDGAILPVPSGELCFAGVEYVYSGDGTYRPPEALCSCARIPAGTYRVTAFEVSYDMPQSRVDSELDQLLEPGDRRYADFVDGCAMPLGIVVMLAGLVALVIFLFRGRPWSWKLERAGVAGGVVVLVGIVLWSLAGSARMTRWKRADEELCRRYPNVVVILQRLAPSDVPESFNAGRFGSAFIDEKISDD